MALLDTRAAPTPRTPRSKPVLWGSQRKSPFNLTHLLLSCILLWASALPGNGLHAQGREAFWPADPAQLLGYMSLGRKRGTF